MSRNPQRKAQPRPASAVTINPQALNVNPQVVQRVLTAAIKTVSSPEYQQQITKLSQASISNSLQVLQKMGTLSTRLSKMDSNEMSDVVERSVSELTKAFMQYSTDQLVLLQKLSTRTLEILDAQSRENTD